MEKKPYYSYKINIILVSILGLTLIALKHSTYIKLIPFILLILIINGNIKRIFSSKNYKIIVMIIRKFFLILPLYITVGFIKITEHNKLKLIISTIVGMITIFFLIFSDLKSWRLSYCREVIMLYKNITSFRCILNAFYYILTAIGEEIFFRYFIIIYIGWQYKFLSIIISIIFFTLCHIVMPWGEKFTKIDIIKQILFSIISSLLLIFSESLIPCLTIHILYNMPYAILELRKLYIVKMVKKHE